MTTNDFIFRLISEYSKRYESNDTELMHLKEIISVGLIGEDNLERRNAARIVHFFMRKTLIEEDNPDWSAAKVLKDLYDCRTCVDHVAQMYVKGIMEAKGKNIFGMRNIVDEKEADDIILRVFDEAFRIKD